MSQALVSNTNWALFFFVCDTVYETVSHTSFVKTVKSLIGYALREKLITYLYVVDNISVCACYCLSKLKNPLIMSVLGRHISSRPTKKDIIKFVC